MDERRLELKVGLLALLALVIAVVLIVLLSGVTGPRFMFFADFGYAGGLPPGASVKIAGVKVGRIKDVVFRPEGRDAEGKPLPVRLTVEIEPHAASALRADTSAVVGMQGALGESYLELLPGEKSAPLAEKTIVRGLDPPRLDVLLSRAFSLLESAVNGEALRTFLTEVGNLARSADQLLAANKDELKELFSQLASIFSDTRGIVTDVKSVSRNAAQLLASPEVKNLLLDAAATAKVARSELPGLLADTRVIVAKLDKTADALTPDDIAKVKATLARYDALGDRLQKIAVKADDIVAVIQRGDGTVGKAIKDPQVYDDLRALLADIKAKPWKLVWKD